MKQETLSRTKLEFQLAILKELYKNSKIGKKEYMCSVKILDKKINEIEIEENGKPFNLKIKI